MLREQKNYKGSAETILEAAAMWLAVKGRPSVYRCGFEAAQDYAQMGDHETVLRIINEWMLPFQYCIKSDADVRDDIQKIGEILIKQGFVNEALPIFELSFKCKGK